MKVFTSVHRASVELIVQTATLYCQIWKEPPWNEDFWTVEGVMTDMRLAWAKLGAVGLIAENGSPQGFTWGYAVVATDLAKISGGADLSFLFSDGQLVFYLAELGVGQEFRRHHVGQELTAQLLVAAKEVGVGLVTLRTNVRARAAQTLYRRLGFRELDVADQGHPDRTYWLLEL